ncbi:MAG: flagellar biosynthetic protein FliR [Planctomycetes bacterium]|nr:flagellar biosynthetic protein FliR [Planctomycetota bacterium]
MESVLAIGEALSRHIDVPVFALILARLLPIVALTPLFGGSTSPRRFRFAAALALTAVLYPVVAPQWTALERPSNLGLALLREALLGLSIGVVVAAAFDLFASIGGLIDLARGATFANVVDPITRNQASVLEPFLRVALLVVFTSTGLHRQFIAALCAGFTKLPPSSELGFRAQPQAVLEVVQSLSVLSVQLALPILIGMLVLDLSLALIHRAAGRIEVYFLGLTLKSSLGLLLLLLLVTVMLDLWVRHALPYVIVFGGGS